MNNRDVFSQAGQLPDSYSLKLKHPDLEEHSYKKARWVKVGTTSESLNFFSFGFISIQILIQIA